MSLLKQLGLLAYILLNHMRIANGILVHSWVAHLNKQAQAARQKRIMCMMEVVSLATFDQARSIAKVMRHARLNGNNLSSRIGIARLEQRLCHLDHLARFDQLTRDKALHGILVYRRT